MGIFGKQVMDPQVRVVQAGERIEIYRPLLADPKEIRRQRAAKAAEAAGARHIEVMVDEAMVWRHLPEIVACMDDPAADYAIIPTWFLARRARQEVKVVLSGEGGDEIFGGYGRYRLERIRC